MLTLISTLTHWKATALHIFLLANALFRYLAHEPKIYIRIWCVSIYMLTLISTLTHWKSTPSYIVCAYIYIYKYE